jgi:bifunctional enzyme CysN/CysC
MLGSRSRGVGSAQTLRLCSDQEADFNVTISKLDRTPSTLQRADNVYWQAPVVDGAARAKQKRQQPRVLWFTGLSGSGKSTVAGLVDQRLLWLGYHAYLLDGDNVRQGLNRDLGFCEADRIENLRRVAEVARLFVDAGLIVLAAFISPFEAERRMARALFPEGQFVEIYVKTSLEVCMARDPKGLYRRARRGDIKNFTGLDSPYEVPQSPDLTLETADVAAPQLADEVIDWLVKT